MGAVGLCAGLLLWPALINGFPLIYSDTGAYLAAGFKGIPLRDRPVFYGLLLHLASAGRSLWGVVALQAVVVATLMSATTRLLAPRLGRSQQLAVLAGTAALTTAPWYVSLALMDIFTPVLLLAMALFVAADVSRPVRLGLAAVLVVSLTTHTAHPIIALVTATLTAAWLWRRRASRPNARTHLQRLGIVALLVVATMLGMMTMNRVRFGRFVLNPSQQVFLMARLSETPLLRAYLTRTCPQAPSSLCEALPDLPYEDSNYFLWHERGVGSRIDWLQVAPEYGAVTRDILTTPASLATFALDSAARTLRQLAHMELTAFDPETDASFAVIALERQLPADAARYRASRQFADGLGWREVVSRLYVAVLIGATLWLACTLRAGVDHTAALVTALLLAGVVVNAAVMGSLSAVEGRYQGRVAWLVVLLALSVRRMTDRMPPSGIRA